MSQPRFSKALLHSRFSIFAAVCTLVLGGFSIAVLNVRAEGFFLTRIPGTVPRKVVLEKVVWGIIVGTVPPKATAYEAFVPGTIRGTIPPKTTFGNPSYLGTAIPGTIAPNRIIQLGLQNSTAHDPKTDVNQPKPPSAAQQGKESLSELRFAAQVNQLSSRLSDESRNAFERGLMSLPDYASHLEVALGLRTKLANLREDREAYIGALANHGSLLSRAAGLLVAFNQPASKGWAADVSLAKLLATNAQAALATARKDQAAAAKASRQSVDRAQRHYTLRLADVSVGLADLPQWADAASYLNGARKDSAALASDSRQPANSGQNVNGLATYHQELSQIVAQTEKLSQRGAGLGRSDRLNMARFELARTAAMLAQVSGNHRAAHAAANQAAAFARQQFETQLEFYQTRTASLFDLTQAWSNRQALLDSTRQAGFETAEIALSQQRNDLQTLMKLAGETTDLRGRNAADVTLVHSLSTLEELKTRQRAIDAKKSPEKPGTKPSDADGQP
jgi:hypothetical protein